MRSWLVFFFIFALSQGQKAPNDTVNEIAVFMNTGFVSGDRETIQNLVDSLVLELDETVFTLGKLAVSFYVDENPRFTKGDNFFKDFDLFFKQ